MSPETDANANDSTNTNIDVAANTDANPDADGEANDDTTAANPNTGSAEPVAEPEPEPTGPEPVSPESTNVGLETADLNNHAISDNVPENSQAEDTGQADASPENPELGRSVLEAAEPENNSGNPSDDQPANCKPNVDLDRPISWHHWMVVGGPIGPAPKLRNFVRMVDQRNAATRKAEARNRAVRRAIEERALEKQIRKFNEKYG